MSTKAPGMVALLAGLALLLPAAAHPAPDRNDPVRVSAADQSRLFAPAVRQGAAALAELTRADAGPDAIISQLESATTDPGLSPAERDAVLYDYVRRLRRDPPGTAPKAVLEWLQAHRPQAVRRHEESADHWIALFNIRAAAAGLENQWAYESARMDLLSSDIDRLPELLERYRTDPGGPYANGLKSALFEAPPGRLQVLADQAAADPGLSQNLLPHVLLAAGRLKDLANRIVALPSATATAVLSRAARELEPKAAAVLLNAAMRHGDAGVSAAAMARITDTMRDDPERQSAWGEQLLDLLVDEELGAGAALQLARMGATDWLEKAAARASPDNPVLMRRLELMAELERYRTSSSATLEVER